MGSLLFGVCIGSDLKKKTFNLYTKCFMDFRKLLLKVLRMCLKYFCECFKDLHIFCLGYFDSYEYDEGTGLQSQ